MLLEFNDVLNIYYFMELIILPFVLPEQKEVK